MRIGVVSVIAALLGGATLASAQEAPQPKASPYTSVIGTVDKVDSAGKAITVKPDKGDQATVKYDDRTTFSKIPAGETDPKKATPAAASDVAEGDRILARVLTADPARPARSVLLTKHADIVSRQQRTQDEWKTATTGPITSIGPNQIKITSRVPGSPTPKEIAVDISGKVNYQRYNPETGKYEPSTVAAIKTGDQLRVLGQKNADGTEIKAEDIGTGAFKTIGVQIKTIDAAANQIVGTETGSKKPVVIALRADTTLKKFNEMAANMVARQINPTYQQAGGGRRGGGGAPAGGAPGAGAPDGAAAAQGGRGFGGPGGPGGRGFGGGRGRGGMDINRIIEQQPPIQLADLKPGDAIIVTGATGNDPSRVGATAILAGVEPILRAAPNNGADPLAGNWSIGGGAGGEQQ
jgi:hypothetical protein